MAIQTAHRNPRRPVERMRRHVVSRIRDAMAW